MFQTKLRSQEASAAVICRQLVVVQVPTGHNIVYTTSSHKQYQEHSSIVENRC